MQTPPLFRRPKRFIKKSGQKFSIKGVLLYLLPLALIPATIIALIRGDLAGIVVNSGCYVLYLYAARLLRLGLAAEAKYRGKRIGVVPKNPLKLYAAVIVALSTGSLAWLGAGHTFLISIIYALGAFLGMYFSYGFDPRKEKAAAVNGRHGYSNEEIRQTIDAAERLINAIELANDKIANVELNNRLDRICAIAGDILIELEQDPGDIRRARKFLKVYLEGARKVTEGYAKTHNQADSGELEHNFRNILEKIETVFIEQKDKLIANEIFDLDVQIEVLNTQLKEEGIL
jgi:5-bromo-4-chloroindolyl phosphate hydrolysis protein